MLYGLHGPVLISWICNMNVEAGKSAGCCQIGFRAPLYVEINRIV